MSITTQANTLSIPPLTQVSLSTVLAEWLREKHNYAINEGAFLVHLKNYHLNQPNTFQSKRADRLRELFAQQAIAPLLKNQADHPAKHNIETLAEQLLFLLNNKNLIGLWQRTLEQRFIMRNYQPNYQVKRRINVTPEAHAITLQEEFKVTGELLWTEEDEDAPDVFTSSTGLLYSGNSLIQITLQDKKLFAKMLSSTAELSVETLKEVFVTVSLPEKVIAQLEALAKAAKNEEYNILKATYDYLLDQLGAVELQQQFISTTFYDETFRQSASYALIQQVLKEKPLPIVKFSP